MISLRNKGSRGPFLSSLISQNHHVNRKKILQQTLFFFSPPFLFLFSFLIRPLFGQNFFFLFCPTTPPKKMSYQPFPTLSLQARRQILDKLQGCGYGMYIGDALAMPIHWYYNRNQIFRDFGPKGITKYEAPMKSFPGSIMNLSSTGGGGRGSDQGDVVGGVILHGKKKFWLSGGSYHYHHGMSPGENTLDALVGSILMTTCGPRGGGGGGGEGTRENPLVVDDSAFLDKYITFFTTPGTHNDVYAATAHRMFFSNYSQGKDKFVCADNDGHNTDAIDGLINVVPLAMSKVLGLLAQQDVEETLNATPNDNNTSLESLQLWKTPQATTTDAEKREIYRVINLIRQSKQLPAYGFHFYGLLVRVLLGQDIREAVTQTCQEMSPSHLSQLKRSLSSNDDPMTACYVSSSFPVLLHFAFKYGVNDLQTVLLKSANAGGENVNRGTCLGGLMGGVFGFSSIVEGSGELVEGLVRRREIEGELRELFERYLGKEGVASL